MNDSIRADIGWADRIEHLRVTGAGEKGFDGTSAKHTITPELLDRYNKAWAEVYAVAEAIKAHLAETGQEPPAYGG